MSNPYIIAELVLNLVDIGMRRETIRSKVNQAKLEGKSDTELTEMLKKMEQDAILAAQDAINAKSSGS